MLIKSQLFWGHAKLKVASKLKLPQTQSCPKVASKSVWNIASYKYCFIFTKRCMHYPLPASSLLLLLLLL